MRTRFFSEFRLIVLTEVKLLGMSPRGYAADQLNLFDGALATESASASPSFRKPSLIAGLCKVALWG